jgi:hypothetical protein
MLRVGNRPFNGLPSIGTFLFARVMIKAQLGIKAKRYDNLPLLPEIPTTNELFAHIQCFLWKNGSECY